MNTMLIPVLVAVVAAFVPSLALAAEEPNLEALGQIARLIR